ncbi:MAG: GAF domain-containing protein [Anaerolineae bacterium]|nr:GAF domain-containing protein [Anaerolineae bacterium]
MVTTPDEQQLNKDIDRRARNAFYIGLLITIVSGLTVIGTYVLQATSGENYYVWVTAVGIVGGVISMILARLKKSFAAAMLLVSSIFIIAFLYIIFVDSIGTMLTIIITIVSLGITVQLVPSNKLSSSIIIVVLIGASLMMLDQFWLSPRNAPPPFSENIIVVAGIITILVLAFVVIRQYPTYSLRGKLIGATLAVALLAVAVVAFGVNIFTTQAITTEVGDNLNTLTESQALVIGEYLTGKVNSLETLASNNIIIQAARAKNESYDDSDDPPSRQIAIASGQWAGTTVEDEIVKAVLENDAAAELIRFQQLFPDNVQLLVTDKYGGQIAATQRTRDYFKGDEAWWQETYIDGLGSVYIGEPIYDSANRTYSITIGVPIHSKTESGSGEISGVVQAIISLGTLRDILLNSRFGETGVLEIFLEGDRHLVVDEEGEITIMNSPLNQEAIEYVKSPEQLFIITEFDGASHFLSSAVMNTLTNAPAVDHLQWLVMSTQQSDEILAPVDQQRRINTILGMIVVISAGAVAAIVGQRISKPISNLTKVAQEVTAGNLDIQAPIETQDEIGVLANSFNDMTSQLRDSISTLEQRVQNRTQALATTVEVGRQLSTILDEDELITAVVNQVRESFNYYQTQIYLMTDDGKALVMAGATGQAGQQMLANKHAIKVGNGLVGRAAEINQTMLVSNVLFDKTWLPNPLLPDTKAETAVPIAIGDEILGVLDVQQNIINGLQQEDADLLQSVANQVAVALRNARLYKSTQQRARNEALLRSINQKISSTPDMETAMKVAIRELGQATGSSATSIRLSTNKSENGHQRDISENA